MYLIEEFQYVKEIHEQTGKFIYEQGVIRTEVDRSRINFYNSEGEYIEMNWSKLKIYTQVLKGYGDFSNILTVEELTFLSKTYNFDTEFLRDGFLLESSLKYVHEGYLSGIMYYFEKENKEYLVITFDRKSEHLPPQADEDTQYVLGIWESPLLTDEIIEKIKQP